MMPVKLSSKRIGFLIAIILCFVLPPLIGSTYILSFLIVILMYALISSGWNIIGGFAGYNSFGHAFFFGVGAYLTAFMIWALKANMFVALLVGVALTSLLAIPLGYPSLRLRGLYFALATYPINYVGLLLVTLLPYFGGAQGILLKPIFPSLNPLTNEVVFYVLFLVAGLIGALINFKVKRSKFGLGLISIREDEDGARTCGVHVARLKISAYSLSAIPISIAGGLYVCYTGYLDPTTAFAFSMSMYAIALTYMGGRATVMGPLVGSIIFVFFSEYLRYSVLGSFEGLHMVVLSIILILIMIFIPEGIVGYLCNKVKALRGILF